MVTRALRSDSAAIRDLKTVLDLGLRPVTKLPMIVGALVALVGIVLIPLPGPGYPLLIPGAIVLLAGVVMHTTYRRGPRQAS